MRVEQPQRAFRKSSNYESGVILANYNEFGTKTAIFYLNVDSFENQVQPERSVARTTIYVTQFLPKDFLFITAVVLIAPESINNIVDEIVSLMEYQHCSLKY